VLSLILPDLYAASIISRALLLIFFFELTRHHRRARPLPCEYKLSHYHAPHFLLEGIVPEDIPKIN